MKYPLSFSPIKVGGTTIKNRYAMAPMGGGPQSDSFGAFSKEAIEYYTTRARGGVGLIFTGVSVADNIIDQFPPKGMTVNANSMPVRFVNTGTILTEQIHSYGCKIFMQLGLGSGRNGAMNAPSEIPFFFNPQVNCHALTKEEIDTKVDCLVRAAVLARDAGFDGIEVHAIHEGYLLDEFAMAFMNHRTDEYGGSLENRLRLPGEILQKVKAACGANFPVSIRLGLKTYIKDYNKASIDGADEVGRTLEEGIEIAKILERQGYDMLSVDSGTYDSYYWVHPPMYQPKGLNINLAEACKKAVSIPVWTAGRMDDAEMCETALDENKTDGVVIGRALLADPDYVKKLEVGKAEKIRPCLACHVGCAGRIFNRKYLSCALNPQVLREYSYGIYPAAIHKNVLVIGGGVGGMEAARVSAIRGHKVTLIEKAEQLGGNLIAAGMPSFKEDDHKLIEWYERELAELKVDVQKSRALTAEEIIAFGADAVILATGSKPLMPQSIKGVEKSVDSISALCRKAPVGQKVVVVGGGLVGCEIAYEQLLEGKDVTIVEMLDKLMSSGMPVPVMNRMMLLDLLDKNKANILTSHSIVEVTDEGAVVRNAEGKETTLEADTVIMAIGFSSVNELYDKLLGNVELYEIGDCKKVSNVLGAVWDAYEVARNL